MSKNSRVTRCRYCGASLLSDRMTCPNCGVKKQHPFYLQGEFWGLLTALALSIFAFAAVWGNL